ncbi:MFS transporter [Sporolactobacillus sp. THM7-7]|nr:MFS transporter [Sporolactobacillus sp. THM7-7]
MMGDGLEQGWLSPYLIDNGLSIEQSATLFTVYGVTIALSSWLSGVFAETYGIRKAMVTGLVLYLLGIIGFVGIGMTQFSFPAMLLTYAFKGFGYPLFAYSFLVWIAYVSPKKKLGAAVGWFWFFFTGGLNVLGAYYSIWAIEHLGHINTLWSGIIWVLIGAFFALILNKAKFQNHPSSSKSHFQDLIKGLTIVKTEPKVLLGGIVRTINTTAQFAFPVFLPTHMEQFGISTTDWLQIWGIIFTSNILFNLLFGMIGDRIGWQRTILWFGGVGCTVTTLLLYYSPQLFGENLWLIQIAGILWGATLAGYVPLSALMPSLVSQDKGAAISILNLGAGLPVFVGPAIVGLFIGWLGATGVVWILAALFLVSSILTAFITLPEGENAIKTDVSAIKEN